MVNFLNVYLTELWGAQAFGPTLCWMFDYVRVFLDKITI